MAPKGISLARCMHLKSGQCRCTDPHQRQQRPAAPASTPATTSAAVEKKAEFTFQELKDQTLVPAITIDTTNPVSRFKLRGFHKKIIQKVRSVSKEFVHGNTPILSQRNSLLCIDLRGTIELEAIELEAIEETVKVCFELRSVYIKGVLVGESFFELRKEASSAARLVHGSIDLDCGETYFEMFGRRHNPTVKLSPAQFPDAFKAFAKLIPGVGKPLRLDAARYIGLISLMLIEPSRQRDFMEKLCGDAPAGTYCTMDSDCWRIVHCWDSRSKVAKGIDYDDGKEIEEVFYPTKKRLDAIKHLTIVNSTKNLPVKKAEHARVLDQEPGDDDPQ